MLLRSCACSFVSLSAALVLAQGPAVADLDDAARTRAVRAIGSVLREHYVFPDKGEQAARHLSARCDAGAFGSFVRPGGLADAVTSELRELLHDGHLSVDFLPGRDRKSVV